MMEDRRQYYRINDRVSLDYYIIGDEDQAEEEIKAQHNFRELAELKNTMFHIDEKLVDINTHLQEENPQLVEVIDLLNQKFSAYENYLWKHNTDREMNPAGEVNLSANGVAFETDQAIAEGAHLQLEMIVYPENYYIPVYSRVVSCRKTRGNESYSIAVEFVAMSDSDKELIIQHVLKKQAEELRVQRETETIALEEA
jgi:c-di-GMP-binding flagellar brake protein YcgR